ncbi:MAG: LysM peptidoglycan-binding domain-containing protein [Simkaniaceae bacterium]|nr:LysM peptidoglycan-binding domain-containing protein [Simkaniaceae bacterium]
MERDSNKRLKIVTQILVLSIALNIGLIVALGARAMHSRPKDQQPIAKTPLKDKPKLMSYAELIEGFFGLSFFQLLDLLRDVSPIQDGLKKRDIALTCLVDFYDLDIERALQGMELQKRKIHFVRSAGNEHVQFHLYPGLKEEHFAAILAFVKQEKWPLTARGLFYELLTQKKREHSLYDAFALSDCFRIIHTLFARSGYDLTNELLIDILLDGEWEFIEKFVFAQQVSIDFSPRIFDAFIFQFLKFKSAKLFQVMIEDHREDVIRRIDDALLVDLIARINDHNDSVDQFLRKMILSIRTDTVREAAGKKLYELLGERPPEPYQHQMALQHFFPRMASHKTKETALPTRSMNEYTVKPGDSLWLIAKKYKVSVDDIIETNQLSSKKLDVGMKLCIPEK